MNLEFFLMVGTFLAGVLTMGWIKSFQLQVKDNEIQALKLERDQAKQDLSRTIGAANVVVDAERKIDHAGSGPRSHSLGVLLDDAKQPPAGPGRSA